MLLFLLFGVKWHGKGRRRFADPPRVTALINSDGRADQSLSVKWKKR
ncbi:MAG: hypothetical protein WDN76_01365 [Alphaproteobacteria bacterium]